MPNLEVDSGDDPNLEVDRGGRKDSEEHHVTRPVEDCLQGSIAVRSLVLVFFYLEAIRLKCHILCPSVRRLIPIGSGVSHWLPIGQRPAPLNKLPLVELLIKLRLIF